MNTRALADLLTTTGFSSPATARAYFDAVMSTTGRPRRKKRGNADVWAVCVLLASVALAVAVFA